LTALVFPKYLTTIPDYQFTGMPQPNWFFAKSSLTMLATAENSEIYHEKQILSTKCQKKMPKNKKITFFYQIN